MARTHVDAPMTADDFTAWAADQPGGRYELSGGVIVAMAPERAAHGRTKGSAYRALGDAVAAVGAPCEVFTDGMAVRIDDLTQYEPDAAVRCGAPLDGDALVYDDPVIVVEVVSPSSRSLDTGAKLAGYFRLASLRHYLVIDPDRRTVVHHRRAADGSILTAIMGEGVIELDPPGIAFDIGALFA
jgi:Uma2 family endonuclease